MSVERTAELQELFSGGVQGREKTETAQQQHQTPPEPLAAALKAHPIYKALSVMISAQQNAGRNATRCLRETLTLLESSSASLSAARVESALLLCEAELLNVSTVAGQLTTSIRHAAERSGADKTAAVARTRRRADSAADAAPAVTVLPAQFLECMQEVVAIIRSRNTQHREKIALAKEELALWKSEMFVFSRCGVVTCEPADLVGSSCSAASATHRQADSSGRAGQTAAQHQQGDRPTGGPAGSGTGGLSGMGLVSRTAKNIMHLDSVLSQAVDQQRKTAGQMLSSTFSTIGQTAGLDGLLNGRQSSLLASLAEGLVSDSGKAAAHRGSDNTRAGGVLSLSAAPAFTYTAEEESQLQQQHAELIERQRAASVHDAKLVEASVRELSQLTSLMNEKVSEQQEHFSILMKNTDEIRTNYDKALRELDKTKRSGALSSTRQTIILLWLCSGFLMVANFLLS